MRRPNWKSSDRRRGGIRWSERTKRESVEAVGVTWRGRSSVGGLTPTAAWINGRGLPRPRLFPQKRRCRLRAPRTLRIRRADCVLDHSPTKPHAGERQPDSDRRVARTKLYSCSSKQPSLVSSQIRSIVLRAGIHAHQR